MKKIYTFLMALLFALPLLAQVPVKMSYQAVVRDKDNALIVNSMIGLRISILQYNNLVVYEEIQTPITNDNGLISIEFGGNEDFSKINWAEGTYFIKTEIDPSGGDNYTVNGTSQMLSVPFAMYALSAGSLSENFSRDADPGVTSQNWSLFGNLKSNPLTDKLGTTDFADLILVTNNLERIRIYANGDIDMGNSLDVGANLKVQGNTDLDGTLNVDGATDLNNTLNVDGETDLNSALRVNNLSPTNLTGLLEVDGATTLHDILTVDGATDLNNTLNVDGETDLNSALRVNNSSPTNLTGILGVDGAVDLNSTLNVDGETNLNAGFNVNNASPVHFTGSLEVDGATELNNTLNVDGASTLKSTLGVDGAANLNSTLGVLGATTLSNTLGVIGATNLSSTITVNGAADMNSSLNVDGITNLNSTLSVDGATTINNTTGLNGQVTINANVGGGDASYGAYPLRVQGSGQGIAVKLTAGTPNNSNNFITFFDSGGGAVGRIEGETAAEKAQTPEFIYEETMLIADEVMSAASLVAAAIPIPVALVVGECLPCLGMAALELAMATANLIAFNIFELTNMGVTYQSGSADYAEWLERNDPAEMMMAGDIVGVYSGKVSKYTLNAKQFLVISTKPAMLGNMPAAGKEYLYEKVAFMGQIPVKVRGVVFAGDYILPSGLNDGTGIAVSPEEIAAEQYREIIGVAWSNSLNTNGVSMINMAIGLNANDVANLAVQQEKKIRDIENHYKSLEERLLALENGTDYTPAKEVAVVPPVSTQILQEKQMSRAEMIETNMPTELSADVIEDAILTLENAYIERGINYKAHPGLNKLFTDASFRAEIIKKAQDNYKNSYQFILEKAKNMN